MSNFQSAELFVRLFTAILFIFQGYDKLFRVRISGVIEVFRSDTKTYKVPNILISSLAYYTSIAEFVGGFFLLLGFCTNAALYVLGLDILLVSIAFSYVEPMWNMKHVFPRMLLLTLLFLLSESRQLSLDYFLSIK